MIPPTLTDLYRSIEAEAKRNSAEAAAVRRAMGIDPAPIRPPFWIDIRHGGDVVESKSAGGDLREARRLHSAEAYEAGLLSYTAVLTDSTGKALS